MRRLKAIPVFAALVLIVGLAGCGFTPVYGTGSTVGQALSDIQLEAPNTREEYLFVRNMEQRLTRNPAAQTTLKYSISFSEKGLDLIGVSRSQLLGSVSYRLISQADGQVVASGSVESFTSFSPRDDFPLVAIRDARERLFQILADRVISDLTAKLAMN
ncbi:hypothetical protein ACGYKB_18830 [Sulfitobacter sp. 916]|uniref:hypothetical protein n=1 Tax=Sulfitobacter sp. 916 TaxID=3368559 RepID=UPI00374666EE